MAEQLRLDLRTSRQPGDVLRFDTAFALDWKTLDRRAGRLVGKVALQAEPSALRDGFALRRYAEDAALLEALRDKLSGKHLKRAVRGSGRMQIKATVLWAVSHEGRRLHALVDRVEERLAAREAVTLCG